MVKKKITKKQLFEFGIIMGLCIPVIIGFLIPLINGHSFQLWTLWLGFSFLIIGIIKPKILFYPYILWMKIGNVLGWINSHIILGLVFIFVLQPIAYIMRLTGYDPLRTKQKGKKTYREIRKDNNIDLNRIF